MTGDGKKSRQLPYHSLTNGDGVAVSLGTAILYPDTRGNAPVVRPVQIIYSDKDRALKLRVNAETLNEFL